MVNGEWWSAAGRTGLNEPFTIYHSPFTDYGDSARNRGGLRAAVGAGLPLDGGRGVRPVERRGAPAPDGRARRAAEPLRRVPRRGAGEPAALPLHAERGDPGRAGRGGRAGHGGLLPVLGRALRAHR